MHFSKREALLATVLSSAIIPSAAWIAYAHLAGSRDDTLARAALADVVVDAPGGTSGLIDEYGPVMDELRSRAEVTAMCPVLVVPALLVHAHWRERARLVGLPPDAPRLPLLSGLLRSGSLAAFGRSEDSLFVGVELARRLHVRPGGQVEALSLAPGPEALGARRRSLTVIAVGRAGLTGFDRSTAIGRLSALRALVAPGSRVSAIEALAPAVPLEAARVRILDAARQASPALRARARNERDWHERDGAAAVALGRSTLLAVFVVALLALAASARQGWTLAAFLRRLSPVALLSLAISVALALPLASLAAHARLSPTAPMGGDLARLGGSVVLALLMAPLLAGRIRATAAAMALTAVVAIATVEPSASTVLARLSDGRARAALRAAAAVASAVSSGPVAALAIRGSEVAPVDLVGIDPRGRGAARLLEALSGRRGAVLRPPGLARPLPWLRDGAQIDDLLAALATNGGRVLSSPDETAPQRPRPGIVLGAPLAQRLGARLGDEIAIAAAPEGLEPGGEVEPPWPVSFEVVGLGGIGLRSADDSLALADAWQVDALGGRARQGAALRLDPRETASRAARPFVVRARRAACIGAIQISALAVLLGAALLVGPGRERMAAVGLGAVALGVLFGAVMGASDAAHSGLGLGSPVHYEVAPSGSASLGLALGLSTLAPAAAAIAASAIGMALGAAIAGRSAWLARPGEASKGGTDA
jgi:ABC-type lipoprotein release transport system permease subunit